MNVRAHAVALRVLLIISTAIGGFPLLQQRTRRLETQMSELLVNWVAPHHASIRSDHVSIVVVPYKATPFIAIITPSCSSIASLLALGALAAVAVPVSRRAIVATTVGLGLVLFGNVLRIAASIGVGLLSGRASLILFHDWVGGLMTFVFTFGGYIALLWLLLPKRTKAEGRRVVEHHEASAG